jgi:hypothetical protein
MKVASSCVCCESNKLTKIPAVLMPFVAHRVFGWEPIEITKEYGLNTIPSGHAYNVCKTLYCLECELLFLDMRFDNEEIAALYTGYRDEEYTALRDFYEPGYRQRAETLYAGLSHVPDIEKFLAPYLKFPIRVLDWGGDTGINTPFKDNHIDIYDISNTSVAFGQKVDNPSADYDLIVCANVLEHVPYPSNVLANIKKVMNPDTILSIEVPLDEIPYHQKRYWHEHVNFFTPLSLKKLLMRYQLSIIDTIQIDNHLYHPYLVACKLEIK